MQSRVFLIDFFLHYHYIWSARVFKAGHIHYRYVKNYGKYGRMREKSMSELL